MASGRIPSFPHVDALAAGSATITIPEVLQALRQVRPTSAPGPDSLPYLVWTQSPHEWAPILANLFSAIGHTGATPESFSLGRVSPIFKGTPLDPLLAASYRPITLLNSTYRLLARILANRFGPLLGASIEANQTGFLPKRRISHNIHFTSLLPQVLLRHGLSGATIFVDISKAFDTVDRSFLLHSLRTLGASDGMLHWTSILLHETRASTTVQGCTSPPSLWLAGVRQGCPLSPLLYLCVAQALSSWLRAQPGLGISMNGFRYVSTHHADDTQIHMAGFSPEHLSTLSSSLAIYSQATGQDLNPSKSAALFLGVPPTDPPPALGDIPCRPHVISLGIPQANPPPFFSNTPPLPQRPRTRLSIRPSPPLSPPPPPAYPSPWPSLQDKASHRAAILAHLPLSAFGRCLAASSYCLSPLLFMAEFLPLPVGECGGTGRSVMMGP